MENYTQSILFVLLIIVLWSSYQSFGYVKPRYNYQDIIINGQVYFQGIGQNCDGRYQIIKKILDQYKRPITVLDIGAAEGYFSFRIAKDYDACCVMISPKEYASNEILKLCHLNNSLNNIILLNKKISVDELTRLGECEHFDVVLCFNVLEYFGENLYKATDAVIALGDHVIIDAPPVGDNTSMKEYLGQLNNYLRKRNGKEIGKFPRHTAPNLLATMYLFNEKKTILKRRTWISKDDREYHIESSFERKALMKKFNTTLTETVWQKGINFLTFKMLSGVFPTPTMIKKLIAQIKSPGSNDWLPHNFILQGKKMVLIDQHDPRVSAGKFYWPYSEQLYQNVISFVDLTSPKKITEDFFRMTKKFRVKQSRG